MGLDMCELEPDLTPTVGHDIPMTRSHPALIPCSIINVDLWEYAIPMRSQCNIRTETMLFILLTICQQQMNTALHFACKFHRSKTMEYLLMKAGASYKLLDDQVVQEQVTLIHCQSSSYSHC